MTSKNLTVEEVLMQAQMLDHNLDSFEQTAPQTVAALGGRDGLAKLCQHSCIGPVPRLDQVTWAAMSAEYEGLRADRSINHGLG